MARTARIDLTPAQYLDASRRSKRHRAANGLTQTALAQILQCPRGAADISAIERRADKRSSAIVKKILDELPANT